MPLEAAVTPLPLFTPAAEDLPATARFFRVLGDPTRLRILSLLLDGERNVTSLVRAVGASQSRISNHLACLRWCHLVTAERRGRQVIYRIADPAIGALVASTAALIDDERRERLACCKRIGSDEG